MGEGTRGRLERLARLVAARAAADAAERCPACRGELWVVTLDDHADRVPKCGWCRTPLAAWPRRKVRKLLIGVSLADL